MTISIQDRPSTFYIRWFRDSEGNLQTFVENTRMQELVDSETGAITPIKELGTLVTAEEIATVVEGLLPELTDQLTTAQTAATNAIADKVTAVNALAAKEAQRAALQAQIDVLTAPPPAPTEIVVSRMQALIALESTPSGVEGVSLLDVLESHIAESAKVIQIYWANASEFHRNHPVLTDIAHQIGLTDEQIDSLFLAASHIV
jgi:hypothetical protein